MALTSAVKLFAWTDHWIRRNPLLYRRIGIELDEFEALDEAGRRHWRDRRLRQVLAAARRSEYGRRVGAPEFLGDWPILEKDLIRQDPDRFVTMPSWQTVSASTSGTTGMPLKLRRSLSNIVYEQHVLDRLLRNHGVDPRRVKAAVLRGDDVKSPADRNPPFWRLANGQRRLVFSSNHLDADTLPAFVQALRDYAPDVIFAYPTVLDSLCSLMLQRGDRLQVPLTACGSEVLTRETVDIARAALGTRVVGYYGQAERVAWAYGDPYDGYRFLQTYSVNELRFIESADDTDVYEVIGTGLWSHAMPLVRYRTGDQIRLRKGASAAAVADGRESFVSIIGRSGDYIVGPSGARLLGIDHIPRNVPHVVRTQFIQESPESITLLVVPAPGFNEESRQLLLQHASLKLPPSMRIRIETTACLIRNGSGKAPLIVRKLPSLQPERPMR